MDLEFQEYRARKIVNVHRHVDGPWFWEKYSAHPYVGCRSGCEFCYLRGGRYLGRRDPDTFDKLIQVKINAPELLRKELSLLPRDVIACGDWQQPAEDRYLLSRQMLEILADLAFPLFVVERSPLLTRDLDLLVEINSRAWVGVAYSLSSVDDSLKQIFEPRSPGIKRRLESMERLAKAGILVGGSLMPIIPFAGDDVGRLENTVVAIRDHGGSFVMAGGLTMEGVQAERTLKAVARLEPTLEASWRQMYNWHGDAKPNYGASRDYNARLGLKVAELCIRYGLKDRMPRCIAPGPLAINKRVAERLFLKTYSMELAQGNDFRTLAYRKAAWTIDELPESVAEILSLRGEAGLVGLPSIGPRLAREIGGWLREYGEDPVRPI